MKLLMLAVLMFPSCCFAQDGFDVATVHLSSGQVRFERDGEMSVSHGTLRMHDVTLITCIKCAYHVQRAQIVEPEGIDKQHYDLVAKVDSEATADQMRVMLRGLLAERFALKLHAGTKDVNAYVITVAPQGLKKMKPSASQDDEAWHQNSAMGMVARGFTMQDFVTYMSDPLGAPLVDETHLPGRYDFDLNFRPYVDQAADIHADPQTVLKATFEGELGLKLVRRRATIDTLVIDHVAAATPN